MFETLGRCTLDLSGEFACHNDPLTQCDSLKKTIHLPCSKVQSPAWLSRLPHVPCVLAWSWRAFSLSLQLMTRAGLPTAAYLPLDALVVALSLFGSPALLNLAFCVEILQEPRLLMESKRQNCACTVITAY